ncbi:unnamed protein product [Mytilus edulis]|uniref:Uncharacterized protein n=1 Tax=Mytilus edulis TaxID=6550 RepID=A0A8S3UWF8_MYTED|nr:unnamed protein product [Mytilus edulis]
MDAGYFKSTAVIFNLLVGEGKHVSHEFADTFIENKHRNSRIIDLLRNHGHLCATDLSNCQLTTQTIKTLRSKNLIMESKYISETFLVELMIRILYNSSRNKWLMDISKDSFSKPETSYVRHRLSSTFFPVTTEKLNGTSVSTRSYKVITASFELFCRCNSMNRQPLKMP